MKVNSYGKDTPMTDSRRMQCELLTENQIILLKNFPLESFYVLEGVSSIYAYNKSLADSQRIKHIVRLIKDKTKKFSYFQASLKIILAAILSLELEPEKLLDKIIDKYSELRKHFRGSQYLPYAAYLLVKHGENITAEQIKEYHTLLRSERPAWGVENDIIFATLYAIFGKKAKYAVSDIQTYRKELASILPRHSAKTVARIFVFGEQRGYTEKFIKLKKLLDESKIKIGKANENAAIALFALLDIDEESVEDMLWKFIDHIEKFSKKPKLIPQKRRTMYSSLILYEDIIKDIDNKALMLAKEAAFAVALSIAINLTATVHA